MDTTFKGAARRLDDLDLPKLGARIGVGEDEIHAFLDVETSGHGFDAHGRPIILFEPHVFFRNLSGAKRAQAVAAGLAYVRWGEKPYPRDSYPRLKAAIAIDETAALRSASWGLGQVLGENFKAAGFPTVQAMVEAMMEDEALQLAAAVNFIAANRLDGKLRKHDWAGFAKGYNGASFGKNAYDYQACRRVPQMVWDKDTPWPPAAPAQPPAPVPPQLNGSRTSEAEPGRAGDRPGPLPGFWAAVLAPLVAAILSLFRKAPSLFRKAKP